MTQGRMEPYGFQKKVEMKFSNHLWMINDLIRKLQ